jgi:hypothetical protein
MMEAALALVEVGLAASGVDHRDIIGTDDACAMLTPFCILVSIISYAQRPAGVLSKRSPPINKPPSTQAAHTWPSGRAQPAAFGAHARNFIANARRLQGFERPLLDDGSRLFCVRVSAVRHSA